MNWKCWLPLDWYYSCPTSCSSRATCWIANNDLFATLVSWQTIPSDHEVQLAQDTTVDQPCVEENWWADIMNS